MPLGAQFVCDTGVRFVTLSAVLFNECEFNGFCFSDKKWHVLFVPSVPVPQKDIPWIVLMALRASSSQFTSVCILFQPLLALLVLVTDEAYHHHLCDQSD